MLLTNRATRIPFVFLSVAIFLIGLGYIFLHPPLASIDEYAHYSIIRQTTDTGTIPKNGNSRVAQEVVTFLQNTPMPFSMRPPHGALEGCRWTYPQFFQQPENVKSFRENYREPAQHPRYTPSAMNNWEAQHPPLYYLVMTLLMRATEHLSFAGQVFTLRLASFLLALIGFAVSLHGTLRQAGPTPRVATAFLIYPLAAPMFFLEFARIGNDSLCLFLVGILWSLALQTLRDERDKTLALALGATLALGLLTKALFLPIALGLTLFLLTRAWRDRKDRALTRQRLSELALMIVFPAVASLWYIHNYLTFGTLTGSTDEIRMLSGGSMSSHLSTVPVFVMVYAFFGSLDFLINSWLWSWWADPVSVLKRPSELIRVPALIFTIGLIALYLRRTRMKPITDAVWLPVWLTAPVLIGLAYHIFVVMALNGYRGTPGWYLHVLLPAIATAFAIGLQDIERTALRRSILKGFLLWFVAFFAFVTWAAAATFGGCARAAAYEFDLFPDRTMCLNQWPLIVERLDVLAWPISASICLIGGLLAWLIGLRLLFKKQTASPVPYAPTGGVLSPSGSNDP